MKVELSWQAASALFLVLQCTDNRYGVGVCVSLAEHHCVGSTAWERQKPPLGTDELPLLLFDPLVFSLHVPLGPPKAVFLSSHF